MNRRRMFRCGLPVLIVTVVVAGFLLCRIPVSPPADRQAVLVDFTTEAVVDSTGAAVLPVRLTDELISNWQPVGPAVGRQRLWFAETHEDIQRVVRVSGAPSEIRLTPVRVGGAIRIFGDAWSNDSMPFVAIEDGNHARLVRSGALSSASGQPELFTLLGLTGRLVRAVRFPWPFVELTARFRGTFGDQLPPRLRFGIDQTLAELDLPIQYDGELATVKVKCPVSPNIDSVVTVEFLNDFFAPGRGDRNLFIGTITARGVPGLTTTSEDRPRAMTVRYEGIPQVLSDARAVFGLASTSGRSAFPGRPVLTTIAGETRSAYVAPPSTVLTWRLPDEDVRQISVGVAPHPAGITESAPVVAELTALNSRNDVTGRARVEVSASSIGQWSSVALHFAKPARASRVVLSVSNPGQAPPGASLAVSQPVVVFAGDSDRARPNLLLIVVDSLRADLGARADPGPRTPVLSALERTGVRFSNAFSNSSWTRPSVAAILTGCYPSAVGGVSEARADGRLIGPRLDSLRPTLGEQLRANGYSTLAVADNSLLLPELGYSRGFDRYVELATGRHDISGATRPAELLAGIRTLLRENGAGPWFAYIHLQYPHYNYEPPALAADTSEVIRTDPRSADPYALKTAAVSERASLLKDALRRYAGEVSVTDSVIGEIVAIAKQVSGPRGFFTVVTADHGEEFLEHLGVAHSRTLYAEVVRVPLVISGQGLKPTLAAVQSPVQLVDIVPTVLDLLKIPDGTGPDGSSLVPLFLHGRRAVERMIVSQLDRVSPVRDEFPIWTELTPLTGLRLGRYFALFERDVLVEAYDFEADPGEHRAIDLPPSVSERMAVELSRLYRSHQPPTRGVPTRWGPDFHSLGYLGR